MYRRKEDIQIREVTNAFGGQGAITFYDWLLPKDVPGHGRAFSKVIVPAGCTIGQHTHAEEIEAFYILEGTATITNHEGTITLHTGDMGFCEDGQSHYIENKENQDLIVISLILNTL